MAPPFVPASLPDLILGQLLGLLDAQALLRLAQLNQAWRRFVHHSECATSFWQERIRHTFPLFGHRLLLSHADHDAQTSLATLYFLALRHARIVACSTEDTAPSMACPPDLVCLATSSFILRVFTRVGSIALYDTRTLEHLETTTPEPDSALGQACVDTQGTTVLQGSDWILCQPRDGQHPAVLWYDDGSEHELHPRDLTIGPAMQHSAQVTHSSGIGLHPWVYCPTKHMAYGFSVSTSWTSNAISIRMEDAYQSPEEAEGFVTPPTAVITAANGGVCVIWPQRVWYAQRATCQHGWIADLGPETSEHLADQVSVCPVTSALLLFSLADDPSSPPRYNVRYWCPPTCNPPCQGTHVAHLARPISHGVCNAGFSSDGQHVVAVLPTGRVQRIRVGTWELEADSGFAANERVVHSTFLGGLGVYVVVPMTPSVIRPKEKSSRARNGMPSEGEGMTMHSAM